MRVTSTSPQRPSDIVVETTGRSAVDVQDAATAARSAQREWINSGAAGRAAALTAAAGRVADAGDELTELMVREVGKPRTEATGEVARSVSILRYYAQSVFDPIGAQHSPTGGASLLFTSRRPHGVAGLITPWNFPLAIPLWKAAPALACGNAVLLKPAPAATACALRLAELIVDLLPAGLFTVLPGDRETGEAVVDAADVVSFTGSSAVGAQLVSRAAARAIPAQAEMGGQNASIVLPGADHGFAAAHIAAAAMGYAGQKCTATSRVIVVGDPAPFTDALVGAVEGLTLGDPADPGTVVGPVISERAQRALIDAAAAGGRIRTGGSAVEGDGWFVRPTVVDGVDGDAPLACEEVFGPICAVLAVPDTAAAIALNNSVRYGLTTAIFTADLDDALSCVDGVDTGVVKVNAPTSGVDFQMPFGGEKDSSFGQREQGKAALDFYTGMHTVTIARHG